MRLNSSLNAFFRNKILYTGKVIEFETYYYRVPMATSKNNFYQHCLVKGGENCFAENYYLPINVSRLFILNSPCNIVERIN